MPTNFDDLLNAPPVDTKYVFDRWHEDRFRLDGYLVEAKVALRALLHRGAQPEKKFLIISRARSGTTLLRDLLNSHPQINCEKEVLWSGKLGPRAHLNRVVRKNEKPVFGAKILSYQMVQIHRIADPAHFFGELSDAGFTFIHLKRNTFWQTFSLLKAGSSGVFHSSSGKKADTSAITVDIPDFLARLRWSAALLDYETTGLKDIPHLEVDYDTELAQADLFQKTAKKVFEYIGVPDVPVETTLKKLLPVSAEDLIENYEELAAEIARAGLSETLPG